MGCCGRPDTRALKEKNYYERFAYLSRHQKQTQAETVGSTCSTCDAITMGDPCKVCGTPKNSQSQQ